MRPIARALLVLLSTGCLSTGPLAAQADVQKREAELQKSATNVLLNFARTAQSQKVATRAKYAYDLILDHYDADNAAARKAAGWTKVKGAWEQLPRDKRPVFEDKANNEQRYRVVDEWVKTAKKLGDLHRTLGLELQKGENLARASYHLERAVAYYPLDKEAHLALGHVEADGFYGTEEQVAFVKRMREIETKALEIARTEFEVEALPDEQLPEELKKLGLEFHGGKSKNFTIWTRGSQENADNCAKWAERGLEFMSWLVGPEVTKRRQLAARMKTFKWWGFVWTTREREDFLKANPQIWQGKTIEEAKAFANITWQSGQGQAQVLMRLTPVQMHDTLIAWVFQLGLCADHNDALGEGLKNAATWYLQSTSITAFGALPEGTVGRRELKLPESTSWWLRKVRDDALAGADWPINQVPRERLSSFRNDVRLKSWSFMTWVLAKYPEQWYDFFSKCPADKIPFPEEIDKVGEEAFGKPLAEVEAEWREWARGDSGVAAATGYGPPLLPERPNREELAALERMNQIRGTVCAYALNATGEVNEKVDPTGGRMEALPPTDLDAEASMACEAHAKYLTMWPEEHLKWPEAHEENPAREGFSPRGQRAGMRGVILWTTGDPGATFSRDAVDGWIGTVYHRFPLLEHNINRFGYAWVTDNGYSIGVLDMGSLQEPYDPVLAPKFIAWPPPGMKDVPRQFHGIEQPNPLDDQAESERDIQRTGYPVSLQLQKEFAQTLGEARIALFEVLTPRAKAPAKHFIGERSEELADWRKRRASPKDPKDESLWVKVPTWDHTPHEPLLKRMEEKEVVFAIPKEHLKANTTYQAEVRLVAGEYKNQALVFVWEFTTGSQMQGLKF